MAACAHSTDWAINSHLYNFGHDDASMIDDETGLERNAYGIATAGPLEEQRLEPVIDAYKLFWYSWSVYHSETRVFRQ